jgi:hypothetical protein
MLTADTRERYGGQRQKPSELFEDEASKALAKFPQADQSGDEEIVAQTRAKSS